MSSFNLKGMGMFARDVAEKFGDDAASIPEDLIKKMTGVSVDLTALADRGAGMVASSATNAKRSEEQDDRPSSDDTSSDSVSFVVDDVDDTKDTQADLVLEGIVEASVTTDTVNVDSVVDIQEAEVVEDVYDGNDLLADLRQAVKRLAGERDVAVVEVGDGVED